MELEAWSGVGRPIVWSVPSNRAAVTIAATTALSRRRGLWPAAEAFATWALARELWPDRPALATLLAAADARVARREPAALARERAWTRFLFTMAARVTSRSTGRPPTRLDLGALGLAALVAPRTPRARLATLLLGAALTYDRLQPRPRRRRLRALGRARADNGRPLDRLGLSLARAAAAVLALA